MPRRLLVIDGADQGRNYWLPDEGLVLIGSSHRHADIALNDMWVKRTHAHLKLEPDVVVLSRVENYETMVNGESVTEKALAVGDIIRVGNSQLRLEFADQAEPPPEEVAVAEVLPEEPEEPEFEVVEEAPKWVLPKPVPIDELAQQTFNHYRIEAALGQGQCGVVFRARNLKSNNLVALKLLSPDFPAGPEEMQRFAQALKAGLPLRHPNLVAVLGAGKTGRYCWIAQEYVEGETVAEIVDRISDGRKIRWKRALHVGLDISAALGYLAEQRLVHGNLTPENILIQREDRTAKLGDLVLRAALEGSKLCRMIREKKRLAELPYLAPEQLGAGRPPDPFTDQYSLGAILYALLTGRPPFKESSPAATEAKIREAPPEKPRAYQRTIPNDMQAIVLRLLSKRPEDRYPGPADLLADLQRTERMHEEPE